MLVLDFLAAASEKAQPVTDSIPDWLQVLGIAGTILAGLGAAVGGVAASIAARKSARTSRDALDALAIAIKPSLAAQLTRMVTSGSEYPAVSVTNDSDWDAHDIEIEVTTRDGRRIRDKVHLLLAARNLQESDDESFEVRIPEPPAGSAATTHEALELGVEKVSITFWDHRRIAQYEHVHTYDFEAYEGEESVGYGGHESITDRRLH